MPLVNLTFYGTLRIFGGTIFPLLTEKNSGMATLPNPQYQCVSCLPHAHKDSLFLWGERTCSPQTHVWTLDSQLMALSWEAVEPASNGGLAGGKESDGS